jgi:CRP/FNR family transcriptional regulator, cyclic AMP receptor protein
LYCVIKGSIRLSGISVDDKVTVLDFYGPGIWLGEVSVLDGLPRIHDAHAQGATLLLQVTPADLEELLFRHPALSRAIIRLEAYRLRILLTAI